MINVDTCWTILIAILTGINCSLVGTFLVLRKVAMVGDAIAHAVLPGVVLALFITGSKHPVVIIIGACIMGILTSCLISFLEKAINIQSDAAIGISFTFLFALGMVLMALLSKKLDLDPECYLYGELATVALDTYKTVGGMCLCPKAFCGLFLNLLINLAFCLGSYKHMLVTTFDPQFSQSIGINTKFWHTVLIVITSLTTVITFEITGAILVIGFLVFPAASMYLLNLSLQNILWSNVLFSIICSISGYSISYLFNGSIASSIVVMAGFLFFMVFIFSIPKKVLK